MADAISQQLRREIRVRAGGRCEYCLVLESLLLAGCEVDHIISRKHGGLTEMSNLALSCARCNRAKGSDVGSIYTGTGAFVRLFNPRMDHWNDHFVIEGARIIGLTPIGQITAALLRLNDDERLLERSLLKQAGHYPGP
jgi:HNH endonuclease